MAAVRVFNYEISTNSITPCNIAKGGVQGEHNATQINFNMTAELIGKLRELSEDGRTFCYRFDGYDGTGMKYSFDPEEFTPSTDTPTLSFLVDNLLTRHGGTAQIYLIITLNEEDGTKMELYSYSVKLALKSTPQTDEVTGDDFKSISTLAMIAKSNAKIAEAARAVSVEAQAKTEAAKAALEKGTEWVFDGGNSKTNIEIEQTFDSMMSDTSTNVVQNAVIKKYVDSKVNPLEKDYIVERGMSGVWEYEKWASGKAKCTSSFVRNLTINEAFWNTPHYHLGSDMARINFMDGFFVGVPTFAHISVFSKNYMLFYSITDETKNYIEGTISSVGLKLNGVDVKFQVTAEGRWKE